MRRDLLRRIQRLEVESGTDREPLVVVISPPDVPGHRWECSAYTCQQTGWRCERQDDEPMDAFVERAEREAEEYAQASRSLLILLHPDELEDADA